MPQKPEAPDTGETRTSRLRREQYRKRLDRLLKAAEDALFLDLVWAARMLQSEHEQSARRVISYRCRAAIEIVASKKVAFTLAKQLKDAVNGGHPRSGGAPSGATRRLRASSHRAGAFVAPLRPSPLTPKPSRKAES